MFTGWLQLHPPSTATTTCSRQPPFELRHVHVRLFVFTLAPQVYCTCCGVAVASVLGARPLPSPPFPRRRNTGVRVCCRLAAFPSSSVGNCYVARLLLLFAPFLSLFNLATLQSCRTLPPLLLPLVPFPPSGCEFVCSYMAEPCNMYVKF